ncbi:hypothetical protein LENED_000083 [Lentinula edodes]|uniref:Cytochrome b561 domain-containing protein n=1 Tax=Lentinula edodes TaxID=5353 RepID=A0A1Q3DUU8_LENED|nr:uncharacterized protein C8R40DRAFT_859790 [Lentinula edodes]KAH7868064.1 hypothetical protein C8R40DRAFT_859790 [Lentinula edodes]KAJ3915207.1 hypothetical protein F5877DRAFT_82059 [Lentinula edodes]GAV98690.1 hypothetical protein LENED_000083 [Lentinula edodes]
MATSFPLQPLEIMAKNHAILATTGFLILLPVGVLVARYARTFTPVWFPVHFVVQLFLSGPVIFAAWYYGWKTSNVLGLGHFLDPHQKMGLALLILYVLQLLLGLFTHFIKLRSPFGPGTRSPQNYFHVFLGLVILVLAAEQVHYGLYIEWAFATGGLHVVPMAAKRAWIALIVIFWVLYLAGLALVPRQFSQEKRARHGTPTKSDEIGLQNNHSGDVQSA